jgi:uncharacterized protein YbjT (DUF2867 family)
MPTALVVGATGLVGRHLVRLLAADSAYTDVIVAARRPLPDPPPAVRQRIFDFDTLDDHARDLAADHVFCALGTTRKDAGSKTRFREVDLTYPHRIATMTALHGAHHFVMVSALGASPRSPFFYNRVKAEAEAAVRQDGPPNGAILRPSILGGQRDGRPFERLAQTLGRFAPERWRTIDAEDVARAALALARAGEPGWRIVESAEIRRLATHAPPEGD